MYLLAGYYDDYANSATALYAVDYDATAGLDPSHYLNQVHGGRMFYY